MKFIKNLFKWKTGKINSSLSASVIKPRRTMMALEPRIMFDGAAAEAAADTMTDSDPLMQDTAVIDQDAAKLVQAAADVAPPAAEPQRNEIVFIENNVADYQQLANGVKPGAEVHVLMAGQDGLAQMAQILAGRSGIDAIHIVSHGSDGAVLFGVSFLSSENLQKYSGELAVIGGALTQTGDILLYGCDIGAGASGAAFVSELASATGADVAASSDPTGAAALGGDWQLETQAGVIDTGIALTDAETANYDHLLFTEDFATDPGLGAHPASFTLNGFTYAFSGGDGGGFAWNSSIGVGGTGAVNPFSNSTNTGTTETISITYTSGAFSFTSMEVKSTTHAWTFTGKLGGSTVSGASFTTGVGTVFQTVSFGSLKTIDTLVITSVNFKANTDALDNFITTVPPVNTVPGAQTMLEDTTLTFSSGTSNAITVADSDSDSLTVTLSVTSGSGSLKLAGIGGLSFTTGDGTDDETMTFSGTKADINAALDGLKYTPIANGFNPGYSTLSIATGDGSSTDTDTVTINVTAVNDPPTLMATASSPTYTEGGAAVTLFSGAAISTVENFQTITSLTLMVSNISSTDVLNIDGSNVTLTDGASVASTATNAMTVNVSVTGGTATVTITKDAGIDTDLAQTLVNGVSYRNSGDDPTASGATRVATLTQIKDSGGTANGGVDSTTLSVASTVTVTAINDAPALTATAANPIFTEGGTAATLFSSAAVSAVESADNIEQLVLTVSNVTEGAAEILSIDGSSVALTHGNSVTTATNSMTAGVSLSGNTATVTISKAGGITAAQAQTLVNALAYRNSSDDPTAANRVVTLTAIKDTGGTSNGGVDSTTLSVASTVTVTPVNDAPTLTATASNPTFTEGGAAVTLFSGSAISTVESGQTITSLTLTVSNISTTDVLNIDGSDITLTDLATVASTATNAMTVNVSVAGGTATVTITKAAGISTANAQTLVNGISYRNSGDDPTASGATRVATLTQIKDSGGTANGGVDSTTLSVASTVTVTPVNDAPTLTATAANPTFTEGGAAATLFSSAAVSAVESADNIEQLVLTVSNVTDGAAEILSIDGSSVALIHGNSVTTATNSMTAGVSLSGNTATVTISKAGGITAAQAQTLVNALAYRNSSDDPTAANRVVTLTAIKDTGGTSNGGVDSTTLSVASTVTVTPVNDAPTLTATASNPSFTEGGAATLFSGAAISTVENGQTITSLTMTVSNISTTDVLNIDGSDVTLTDGTAVASTATNAMTVNVSVTGGTATVTITKAAGISRTNAQTLVNGVSYRNSDDDPTASGATRVATLTQIKDSGGTANGGVDSTTLSVASTVTVTAINDAPTLTATAANPTFTEGGAAATLFSGAAISAVESADNIEQLVLTVSNVTDGAAEILSIDGSSVALTHGNSVTTATNSMTAGVSLSGNTATVTISKAGGITAAQAQTLVNALAYRNSSDDPTAANRVVTLTAIKDTGGTSNGGVDSTTLSVASTVTVTAVNDAPTLTATASNPSFTEGGAAVTLFSGSAISTVESGQTITSLKLTVSNSSSTDVLNIDGSDITLTDLATVASTATNAMTVNVSVTGGTATVTITKAAGISRTNAQTLVNGVSYRNSGDDPTASGATRVATLTQIKDSGGTANGGVDTTTLSVASTVTVTPVNDAPTLTATAANPIFTEGGAAATLFSSAAVSAVESADNIEQLVLTVSNVTDGAAEILSIDGSSVALTHGNSVTTATNSMTAGVSLSGNTATVTISKAGGITAAQAQTLVNALAYRNSSDDPTAANRVVTLTAIKDTGGTSNGGVDSTTLSVASTVTVTAVNDAPTVSAPASITVTEDVTTALTGISVSDVDAGSSNVVATFTVGRGALAGDSAIATANSVNVGGTSGALTLTGSIANINAFIAAGGLKFTTASNDTTAVTLGVSVNDQGNTGTGGSQSSATTNVTLNVTAVNDAPTITSGATYTFADTNEETASGGVTVNTLLTVAASWADPDGAGVAKGIAVTGTTGNGTWQYSTDGSTWTDFGTVSGTSALLLDGATQVRYQPDLANGETASFIYKAWDETSGAASTNSIRQTANAGTGGGSAAFSSDSANGSITVTSVNDAPSGVGNLTLAAINEDTSNPTGTAISALTGYSFQDVDTGATTPGILVVGNRANAATEGAWQYSSDGGVNWKAIGAVTDGAAALALENSTQLRFVPAANFNGTPTALNIRVLDNTYNGTFSTSTGGTETRVTADSSANGGATAISGNLNTISTSITAINDAPDFTEGADQTFNADAGAQVVNNWATGLSAGPADESGQTLSFVVSNNNNALFSIQPTIDSNGNLSYTPAANANGSATVTVSIKDSGGTANGGVDTSAGQTFTITVNSTTINLSQISGNTDGKPNPLISMVNTVRADNIAGAGINIDTDKNKIISDSFSTDYRNRAINSFSLDNTGFSTKQAIVVYMELGVEANGNKTPGDTINMPFSVFAGLDTFGGVTITAELSTGQRLPPWISVDPITGAVTVKEGAVVTSSIIVKVTISDSRGNEVVVLVKVQPKQQQPDDTEKNLPPAKDTPQEKGQDQQSRVGHADKPLAYVSKPGLTRQLQMVGSKGFEMQRLKLLDSLASLVGNDKDAA